MMSAVISRAHARGPAPPPTGPCGTCGATAWGFFGAEHGHQCTRCYNPRAGSTGPSIRSERDDGSPDSYGRGRRYDRDGGSCAYLERGGARRERYDREWTRVGLPSRASAAPDGVARALLHRVDPARWPLTPAAQHWTGIPMLGIVRQLWEAGGGAAGRGALDLAAYALGLTTPTRVRGDGFLTTSDFPAAMLSLVRATLTEGYRGAPRTFLTWTRQTTVPDFRPMYRVALGAGPKLLSVPQHAEFQRGRGDVHAEVLQLGTWGRIVSVTRQALINDDLGSFSRLPTQFGYAAAQLEGDLVYGCLTGNPVMSDGQPLFSAAHKNLAAPAGIDLAAMTAARSLMRNQQSSDGQYLGIEPRFLIVGPALEATALQFTSTTIVPTTPTAVIPSYFKALQVVVDPRIDGTSWFLAASPLQIDTIEIARLASMPEEPDVAARTGWEIDGMEFKGRIDRAVAAIEWRGLVMVPGV